MEYIIISKSKKYNYSLLTDTIYENFRHLKKFKELNHTKKYIKENLSDSNNFIILCIDKNIDKIIGYLTGYSLILDDGRTVMYISYIYIVDKFRKNGIGSELLDICENYSNKENLDGLLLTFDTDDEKLMKFYEKRYFTLDFNLRRYQKYDVYYKSLN